MNKKVYQNFAAALDYPTPGLPEKVKEVISLLSHGYPPAASLMMAFASSLEQIPANQMEEIYTRTFDLQAACFPYVGYHLFGEDYRRGMFMAGLKKYYRRSNFSAGNELPDHLGVLLRFLATEADPEEVEELTQKCVIPALGKMVAGFKDGSNPYKGLLQALLLTLQEKGRGRGRPGGPDSKER